MLRCSVAPRVASVLLLRKSSSGEVCRDGFGSRIGRLINATGFKVIATARSDAVVEHLASLGYHAVQLDVTDAASIDRCREIVVGLTGGRLDILMNNAQVPPPSHPNTKSNRKLIALKIAAAASSSQPQTPLSTKSAASTKQMSSQSWP